MWRSVFVFMCFVLVVEQGRCSRAPGSYYVSETFKPTNDRPVIGIVTQETGDDPYLSKLGPSYIRSSYIKYVRQAGAMVVPIKIDMPESYYKEMFSKINGVLYPGGEVSITTSGYARVGQLFYKYAMEAYDKGDYFPMWGTCNGFELLTALTLGKYILANCSDFDISLPLNFLDGFRNSRMYKDMPKTIENILKKQPVTANFHHHCLTPKLYETTKLRDVYRVMSTNADKDGLVFISSMEDMKYPFYGTQFHPEKNNFMWRPDYDLTHTLESALVSQYFANFFVNEARKSQHKFNSLEELCNLMINNYQTHFTGPPEMEEYYILDVGTVREDPLCNNITHV